MKLRFGLISEDRCNEIDSWNIKDPYGYDKRLSTHGNYWVYNNDESILFCHAFMPRHDDREGNGETFLYINGSEYHFINFNNYEINDEERNGELYRVEKVEIFKSDFIEKSSNKKEVLRIFKSLISKDEENSVFLPDFKRIYEFTFYYDGEEI